MTHPAPARALAVAAFVLLAAGLSAAEETVPPYLAAYRAYNAALAAGELGTAATQARAAWRAAERELGDHRLTAILAFNFGQLVVFRDAGAAYPALSRARELREGGIADLAADMTRLYLDFAEFAVDGPTRREADRLRKSLEAFPLDGPDVNPDLALMWLKLALHDAAEERFRKAQESATTAEQAILATSPESKPALAEAILIQGIAHLVPFPRKVKDVQAAHNDIVRALELFEPQADIDSFDPLFAHVLAWDHAARSALRSLDKEDYPDHEGTDWKDREHVHVFRHQDTANCPKLEWEERESPHYPGRALRKGYIGAALIGYRLAGDGTVEDARVLAEVPKETFGEVALDAVKQWRVKEIPPGDPACFRNLTSSIMFIIED